MLHQRRNSTKVLAIIIAIVGIAIFVGSFISIFTSAEFYLDYYYRSPFTYLLGVIFGRTGWGIHFGITLLLISVFFLKGRKVINSENEVIDTHDAVPNEQQNKLSVLEWFGMLVLLAIPLVNIILLLVWAFGRENEKKNFSRAILLYSAAASIVAMIIIISNVLN